MAAGSVLKTLCLVAVVLCADAVTALNLEKVHRRQHGAEQRRSGGGGDRVLQAEGRGEWEKFGHHFPADPASDGNMHWLRAYKFARNMNDYQNGFSALMGHLVVGAAGIANSYGGNNNPINGIAPNPAHDPVLLPTDIATFLTLTPDQQDWLTAAATAWNALQPNAGGANLGGAIPNDPFANCHATIINACAQRGNGAGGDDRNKAMAGLLTLGGATTCYALNALSVAQIQALTAKIAPHTPVMTMAQIGHFQSLSPFQQTWLTQHHAAFTALPALPPVVGVPGGWQFQNCDQTFYSALVAASGGAGNVLAYLNDARFGRVNSCRKLALPLADVQALTALWTNNLNGEPAYGWLMASLALRGHYARFQALLNHRHAGQTFDIWALRGWLYATDRAQGHRLMGACGSAGDRVPGAQQGDPEKGMLWSKDSRQSDGDDGAGQTYGLSSGGPNARAAIDTIGHVRPRSLGGQRDPLNFVPQSDVGQAMVQVAETIALDMSAQCNSGHADDEVRYAVVFDYPVKNVDLTIAHNVVRRDLARRPSAAETTVDLLYDCANPCRSFGDVTPTHASPYFQWHTNTY